MKSHLFSLACLILCVFGGGLSLRADDVAATGGVPGTGPRQAYDLARAGVDSSLQSKVVSIYGTGMPTAIQTWWVIFYDPSVASHGRAVKVDHGQVSPAYVAQGGVVYAEDLTFSPSAIAGFDASLTTAQNYAAKHAIAYDNVRALLRSTAPGQDLRWRIQLLNGSHAKGFVFTKTSDGSFASYSTSHTHTSSSGSGDSVEANARQAGTDIKNTFLGVGGDLQQFFTGERTVDQ